MSSYRTIKLKKYQDIINEYPAGAAITPGSLLSVNSDGEVVVNATAGGPTAGMFALEDELQGKTTRQAYAAGDPVQCWNVQPGEEVLALVDSGFDPDVGAILEPSTGGQLRAYDSGIGPLFQVIAPKIEDDAETPNHRVAVRRV